MMMMMMTMIHPPKLITLLQEILCRMWTPGKELRRDLHGAPGEPERRQMPVGRLIRPVRDLIALTQAQQSSHQALQLLLRLDQCPKEAQENLDQMVRYIRRGTLRRTVR